MNLYQIFISVYRMNCVTRGNLYSQLEYFKLTMQIKQNIKIYLHSLLITNISSLTFMNNRLG